MVRREGASQFWCGARGVDQTGQRKAKVCQSPSRQIEELQYRSSMPIGSGSRGAVSMGKMTLPCDRKSQHKVREAALSQQSAGSSAAWGRYGWRNSGPRNSSFAEGRPAIRTKEFVKL